MMKKWSIALYGIVLFMVGCEPKPSSNDLLKNYVVTTNNYGTNFSQYSTYYLSLDTIAYVYNYTDTVGQCVQCGGSGTHYTSYVPSGYIQIATGQTNTNMGNGHFTKVEWTQNPDIYVFISVVENYSESYYYSGGGYYYGGYYPTVSISDQWTMHIYLFDIKKQTQIWEGDISDLSATHDDDGSLLISAINKAFQQSPVSKN